MGGAPPGPPVLVAIARDLIATRGRAGLSQAKVAMRMETTSAHIAAPN